MQSETLIDGFAMPLWDRLFQEAIRNPAEIACEITYAAQMSQAILARDPWLSLLEYQAQLQRRSHKKFDAPQRWLWTRRYLELASDQHSAELVSAGFPPHARVIDIGCGAGSDAIHLAKYCTVNAIDLNPFAVKLCEANAALQQHVDISRNLSFSSASAESCGLTKDCFVHLDPDRRSDTKRSTQLQWHSPSIDVVERIVQTSAGGAMKLAPACSDRIDSIEPLIARHWISHQRSVVQQRWWWNSPKYHPGYTHVSTHKPSSSWQEISFTNEEVSETRQRSSGLLLSAEQLSEGAYIGDADPAFRSSHCQAALAARHGVQLIGNEEGFFYALRDIAEPFINWSRIMAITPLDVKKVKAVLKAHHHDGLILKTRNTRGIPHGITQLAQKAAVSRGLAYATQIGHKHVFILTSQDH